MLCVPFCGRRQVLGVLSITSTQRRVFTDDEALVLSAYAEQVAIAIEHARLFAAEEIRDYLDHLEHTKYLAPPEPDLERDDLDDESEAEPWLDNPVLGAEELLRFSRIRQLLQP